MQAGSRQLMYIERRWIATCLIVGFAGCLPVYIAGIFGSLQIFGSAVASVVALVLIPSLVTAPRLALIQEDPEQAADAPIDGSFRSSVLCAAFIVGLGLVLDAVVPAQYWVDGVGLLVGGSVLVFSTYVVKHGFTKPGSAIAIIVLFVGTSCLYVSSLAITSLSNG